MADEYRHNKDLIALTLLDAKILNETREIWIVNLDPQWG
jgi:hypothetical protein